MTAGVKVRVELQQLDSTRDRFRGLVARLGNLTPAMDEIGSALTASTLDRFERGKAPDGSPWEPSLRAIADEGQTLVDSARLMQSITHKASQREVEIGTNLIYARIHQFGGQAGKGRSVELPARPYLGASDDDERAIGEIFDDYLSGALR